MALSSKRRVTQTVNIDIQVTAQIDAVAQLDDYGVPGSPQWWDIAPTDWAGVSIEICGVSVPVKALPVELANAIWEAMCDVADEYKWEAYE